MPTPCPGSAVIVWSLLQTQLSRLRVFVVANFKPPIIDPRNLSLWATFISQIAVDPCECSINVGANPNPSCGLPKLG